MNRQLVNARGFTIIEVTLFLAITGLMIAGAFVGISGSMARQQYEDTISSLVDQMQEQYNLINNVRSNRDSQLSCSKGGAAINDTGGNGRGTSECAIVGRLISSTDGKTLISRPVYATADVTVPRADTDDEKTYINKLGLIAADEAQVKDDIVEYNLPWDSALYVNGQESTKQFTLLIVSMPGGLIRTYSVADEDLSPTSVAEQSIAAGNPSLRLCVAASGFGAPSSAGVRIVSLSSNVSGVQRIAAGETGDAC